SRAPASEKVGSSSRRCPACRPGARTRVNQACNESMPIKVVQIGGLCCGVAAVVDADTPHIYVWGTAALRSVSAWPAVGHASPLMGSGVAGAISLAQCVAGFHHQRIAHLVERLEDHQQAGALIR